MNVWAAGESLSMRAIRRHLRDELALPREHFHVQGHWREQLTEDETIAASAEAEQAALAVGASADAVQDASLY